MDTELTGVAAVSCRRVVSTEVASFESEDALPILLHADDDPAILPEPVDTSTSHVGFRCAMRSAATP
jgi:hypothetical protein